jgi:hypothetical protein
LGVPIADEKLVGPVPVLTFLGLEIARALRTALLNKFKESTRDCKSFKVILFSFENFFNSATNAFISTFLHWLVEKKSGSKNLDHYLDDFIFAGEEN